ncbi:hypothetical protein RJ53_10815 [Methanocalculus chunghsingensis]|uniref:Uncharacterized protein n=1 Tax=Methanocalculus chunghsingensis TaxID=156457 RepID=A0A8J8B503_9EURY|nr:hypothetical protein [Methanocalculus chunghsingensis]
MSYLINSLCFNLGIIKVVFHQKILYCLRLAENNVANQSLAVLFSNAKFFPYMRETISLLFECDVLDGYGLNEGDITALVRLEHFSLHIDTEWSVMEIVDHHSC